MNQVMISADSTCDLPANLQRQRHVYCFALSILLGDTAYADGVEIRPADRRQGEPVGAQGVFHLCAQRLGVFV